MRPHCRPAPAGSGRSTGLRRPARPASLRPAMDGPPAPRLRCPRCQRPAATCLCAWLRPTANRVPVWLLQHPLERGQAKGSLPLLQLSLARCRCTALAADGPAADAALAEVLGDQPAAGPAAVPPTLLLYPADADHAATAPPLPLPDPAATRLLVLDGTWRKTRRLLHAHPALAALPRWALPAAPAPRYAAIRRAPRPGQLSTLEAVCHALAALEGDAARYAPLLAAFDGWLAEQAARVPSGTGRRRPDAQAAIKRTG